MTNKITILVFVGWYLPGYKAGGPIRSVANLVESLGDEFNFKIITDDNDFGVAEPYPGISPNTWCKVGKADVYYASKEGLRLSSLATLINSINYDVLYLNSFFCWNFTIKPLLLRYFKVIPKDCIVIAPRGEFSSGALKFKWFKKRVYVFIARIIGFYSNVIWQASSKFEQDDIKKVFSNATIEMGSPIVVAPDLGHYKIGNFGNAERIKKPGSLDMVFLSRISPKKNLDGALSMLKGMQGDITFNVYGPIGDKAYWQACKKICSDLSSNIKVVFHGEVDHSCVSHIFRTNHLFFFPTHGENFGHVNLEALLAGCPVLLSDQTPWRDLESLGVGWDFPLNRPDKFKEVLKRCVEMDIDEYTKMSRCAADYGKCQLNNSENLEQNRKLFHLAVES